jgi:hypothetical protein
MAGTKQQKDSRILNLKKKKKTTAVPLNSNIRFDISRPAGTGLVVSVYNKI